MSEDNAATNGSVDTESEATARVVAAFKNAIAVRDEALKGLDEGGQFRLNFTVDHRFLNKPKQAREPKPAKEGTRTTRR
jgi:hypothetical protein